MGGYAHRSHRINWLNGIAEWLGEKFNRPAWVALPVLVFTTSIICALLASSGTSAGTSAMAAIRTVANPAHYFIVVGLSAFSSPHDRGGSPVREAGPAAVRITDSWYAPVGVC
ncbi:hypothetical protein I553_4063 [Mycobacterium xenopi 4042]|uniref:Uncharacterized protein n=1 Tax=Mycobacterium xenopi 4042 TaxID=1299334 RepID=X7Z008_MYCXE|nr:hypothetical protein I553_4063 [Mycobacterium xenopi 4042]